MAKVSPKPKADEADAETEAVVGADVSMLMLRLMMMMKRVWRVNRNVNKVIAAHNPLRSNESVITAREGRARPAKDQAVCMQQTTINKAQYNAKTHDTGLLMSIWCKGWAFRVEGHTIFDNCCAVNWFINSFSIEANIRIRMTYLINLLNTFKNSLHYK